MSQPEQAAGEARQAQLIENVIKIYNLIVIFLDTEWWRKIVIRACNGCGLKLQKAD